MSTFDGTTGTNLAPGEEYLFRGLGGNEDSLMVSSDHPTLPLQMKEDKILSHI